MFGNQSVALTALWPKKGTLCPIPHWDDECNHHAKNDDASNGAHDREDQLKCWKGKEKSRNSFPQADPPCQLHRYGYSQWFLAKNTMGLWSVTPLPGPGWVGGSLPLTLCPPSPPTVSSELSQKRQTCQKKEGHKPKGGHGGRPSWASREWDLTWSPLYLLTSAAFACRHNWFCW